MSSSKYQMWLSYNSNKSKMQFPVLPEKIEISYSGKDEQVYVYGLGDVTILKNMGAVKIKFNTFFPAKAFSGSLSKINAPSKYRDFLLKAMKLDTPVKFILTGSALDINMLCRVVVSFNEVGGDTGTIYASVTITEYKEPIVRTIKIQSSSRKAKVVSQTSRPATQVQKRTYTVKSGDCLWNIAIKFYGAGAQYTKIYNANKSIIGSNPNRIYPGQTFVIP